MLPAVKGNGTENSKSLDPFFHQSKDHVNLPLKNVPSKPMFVVSAVSTEHFGLPIRVLSNRDNSLRV